MNGQRDFLAAMDVSAAMRMISVSHALRVILSRCESLYFPVASMVLRAKYRDSSPAAQNDDG
jgi:hypothetical protein